MRRILVLRGGALGDFILTLPALALLRQRWPDARIELIGNTTAAELVRAGALLDVVHSQHEARWAALYGDAELPAEFHRWLAAFDLVVSYWPDPDGALARKFPVAPEQRFLCAATMPARSPAAAHYCEPLRALGLETGTYFCGLENGWVIPGAAPVRPPGAAAGPIAIHPGSGSSRKNWPLDRWEALADWLRTTHRTPLVIITGEADRPDALASAGRALRNLPMPDLAAALSGCRLFLGHDSGVSHLAAACGVPSVLLFGPTDPATWAPPAPHVTVIRRAPDLASIALPDVQRAIDAALGGRR